MRSIDPDWPSSPLSTLAPGVRTNWLICRLFLASVVGNDFFASVMGNDFLPPADGFAVDDVADFVTALVTFSTAAMDSMARNAVHTRRIDKATGCYIHTENSDHRRGNR